MNLFTGLNESQKEAASHIDGPMLILAGAGSGKTKTITTRLAYMIGEVGIPAINTLTLTFTNKAASVMKNRALSLLNSNENPLLCTFHKFGLLFLKLHIERLGRKNNFIIIDNDDSKKILKELINDDKTSPHQILQFISHFKNESKSVQDVFNDLELLKDNEIKHQALQKIAIYYQNYQEYLLKHNFVDFDDLLLLTNILLENDQNFAKEQSSFYRYITVDEYQDTNALQYKILKNLCCFHENICVVGDDDQSIYSWRGAKIENILNFQSEFSNVKLVKLEQNYRSVGMILKAANNLISHNKKRLGKTLLCTKDEGEDIQILSSDNEKIESALVAKKIKELLNSGIYAGEIAVLFRINALSRSIEEAFMKEKIPYKLPSGMRFYERLEIKDLICYLRILINPNDDLSFKRIINRPKRSIGEKALQNLEDYAQKRKISLFEALCESDGGVGIFSLKKAQNEAKKFIQNIYKLREYSDLKKMIENFEELFAFKEFYALQEDGDERVLNIDEFYASIKEKIKEEPQTTLEDILSEISLLSDQDGIEGECVYLMSVHASKGLEFDHVFIVGLEEGFFPLNESDIEEERRLAYVAITRAKKCLSLSIAKSRFYRGSRTELDSSRFLEESQLTKKISINKTEQGYHKGDLVKHKIFGIGRVISVNKSAKEEKLTINFGGIERIIMASFVEKAV
ncbi:ATP-dependent helicase [Campylobacter coli]|uniref:ATP-dependent helicase n=1 Tax=Campylobacter coli TaxID=195 RepID=UPI00139C409A|nr:UvrD-helicase domain-containing protein [Campylobacter coli]EAI6557691.1 ATP-dependent helicase [Campylobacter coli]MCC2554689.1 UvrD-helicase domain-containing protein [Campylobacter coli]MCC2556192.1 UvrD-helicase domain-containing protein [Campylobacter coli]MCG4078003.1 UvrD-helicase domain-containing protein [Campylobacter coli]MCG4079486.1 UvrD-helicase domain-containing protein [Campylobacter coli]